VAIKIVKNTINIVLSIIINKNMINEIINVANLKCNGCANTIKKSISSLEGVSDVVVDNDEMTVSVNFSEPASKLEIVEKLKSLGYPEATEENGLLTQAKSYVSCMIGRMN